MLQFMRNGAMSGLFMVLLVMGAAGLVLTDSSGMLSSGIGSTDVIKVGDKTLAHSVFHRQTTSLLRQQNMTPNDAYRLGYLDNILQAKAQEMVITAGVQELGLIASDKKVVEILQKSLLNDMPAGISTQDYLDTFLREKGLTEKELEESARMQLSTSILQKALLVNANFSPTDLAQDLYLFANEQRDFDIIVVQDKDIKIEAAADTETLQEYYDNHKTNYAIPEYRSITLGYILPQDIISSEIIISDEDIQAYYDDNIDLYESPEKRRLEQAIFSDAEHAQKVQALLKDGTSFKKAIKTVTGKTDGYLGEDLYTKQDTIEEVAEAIFAANNDDIVGPHASEMGTHLIRVNEIVPANTQPLDKVKADIESALLQEQLAESFVDTANNLDDLIASESTLEEMIETDGIPLKTLTIESVNRYGQNKAEENAITDELFIMDKPYILEQSFDLDEGEMSSTSELSSGGYFFVLNNRTEEKHFPQLADVKDEILANWTTDQQHIENLIRSQKISSQLKNEEITLKEAAKQLGGKIKSHSGIKRDNNPEELKINSPALTQIFTAKLNAPTFSVLDGSTAISMITKAVLPDAKDISKDDLQMIFPSLHKSLQNEIAESAYKTILKKHPVTINRDLLDYSYGVNRNQQ